MRRHRSHFPPQRQLVYIIPFSSTQKCPFNVQSEQKEKNKTEKNKKKKSQKLSTVMANLSLQGRVFPRVLWFHGPNSLKQRNGPLDDVLAPFGRSVLCVYECLFWATGYNGERAIVVELNGPPTYFLTDTSFKQLIRTGRCEAARPASSQKISVSPSVIVIRTPFCPGDNVEFDKLLSVNPSIECFHCP